MDMPPVAFYTCTTQNQKWVRRPLHDGALAWTSKQNVPSDVSVLCFDRLLNLLVGGVIGVTNLSVCERAIKS